MTFLIGSNGLMMKNKRIVSIFYKDFESLRHLFFVHILGVDIFGQNNVIINEGDKCTSIKFKIDVNTSLGNFRSC